LIWSDWGLRTWDPCEPALIFESERWREYTETPQQGPFHRSWMRRSTFHLACMVQKIHPDGWCPSRPYSMTENTNCSVVWESRGWSSKVQEKFWSFYRNLWYMPRIIEENPKIRTHNPIWLGNTRILTNDARNQCSRLKPWYEFHFEGLSNFILKVEGMVQIQYVNRENTWMNFKKKITFNLCMNFMIHVSSTNVKKYKLII
jgi:hypothetical protein